MSYEIAISDPFLFRREHYEPASKDGADMRRGWMNHRNYLQHSASDWTPLVDAALRAIHDECCTGNRDGEDEAPVSLRTIELTKKIVDTFFVSLPPGTPPPDLVAEPDGEISVSWMVGAERMFAVSIGEHGKLNFAGQLGDRGARHGWIPVDEGDDGLLESDVAEMARKVALLYT